MLKWAKDGWGGGGFFQTPSVKYGRSKKEVIKRDGGRKEHVTSGDTMWVMGITKPRVES